MWGHITIEPSYQSSYSTYFGKYDDYSINNIMSSVGNPTNEIDIQFKNNQNKKIIDISTSIFGDISFSFILNYLFKYNFKLTTVHKPITRVKMIEWVTAFKSNNVSNMSNVKMVSNRRLEYLPSQICHLARQQFQQGYSGWDT